MKKIIFLTFMSLIPLCCFAEFETKIFGLADNQFVARGAKDYYAKKAQLSTNNKNYMLNSNIKIGLAITSQEVDNLKYGANINFATVIGQSDRYDSRLQKTFLFFENKFGRVELGSNDVSTTILSVGPSNIAAASGGAADGDWIKYVPNPKFVHNSNAVYFNPLGNAISFLYRKDNNHESPRKITYFTPKLNNFQLGASYTPDASNTGAIVGYQVSPSLKRLKNVVSVALKYSNQLNGYDTALSLGYDRGVYQPQKGAQPHYNLKDYNLGLILGKNGLNFAASYGNAGKSLKEEGDYNNYKEYYYSLGLAYNQEKYNISLSYMASKIGKMNKISGANYTTLKAYSLGADYEWMKGLKLYAEATIYSVANPYIQKSILSIFNGNSILPKNKGVVYIVGGKIQF